MYRELDTAEIDMVAGGPIPLVVIAVGKVALAAATSTTAKAVFAGAFVAASAAAVAFMDD